MTDRQREPAEAAGRPGTVPREPSSVSASHPERGHPTSDRRTSDHHPSRAVPGRAGLPWVSAGAYAAAALAWVALAGGFVPVPVGAAVDVSAPGVPEAMGTSGGLVGAARYLLMWGLMMVAMMYPSSAGVFQWYADRSRTGSGSVARSAVAFVGSYTLLWVLVGLAPLVANALVPVSSLAARWGTRLLGLALLVVGAFQLSPVKRRCLGNCRALARHRSGGSSRFLPGAVRSGLDFGLDDLGSCGVLMGLMVVVGSMNVGWMALTTAVITVERLAPNGLRWARAFGALAVASGLWLLVAGPA